MPQPKNKVQTVSDLADELDRIAAYVADLELALMQLLQDVEGNIDYGMPFSNPEHGFYESVMRARQLLNLKMYD